MSSREALNETQIREAFDEYCSGVNINKLAARYHVCRRTLERMFARRNLRKSVGKKLK